MRTCIVLGLISAMEKKKLLSLKEVKTGFRDLRNDMVFHSGEEQTRKNRQLMMGDKPSRNFTVTQGRLLSQGEDDFIQLRM